jgi:hypothetical protein
VVANHHRQTQRHQHVVQALAVHHISSDAASYKRRI